MPFRIFVAILIGFLSIETAFSSSTGPSPGFSGVPAGGGFPAEGTCASCHQSFPLNPDAEGKLKLSGVPDTYEPGRRYPLTFTISHPSATRWGFQVTAVDSATFRAAGDFASEVDDHSTQRVGGGFGGRVYIEHGAIGKAATGIGQTNSYTWRFDWVAPTEDVAGVEFFGAGNAADGDGSPSGDRIYSASPEPLARTRKDSAERKTE
jgi:hypothetical protein